MDVTPDVARAHPQGKASDGWAAGIVLMREHAARYEVVADEAMLPEGKGKRCSSISPARSSAARGREPTRVLMLAALLPSGVAGRCDRPLVGNPRGAARARLRCTAASCSPTGAARPVTSRCHRSTRFREFLEQGRPSCRRRSGAALDRAQGNSVAANDFDAAASLYIEPGRGPPLVGLTLHRGTLTLLAEGRRKALVRWLAAPRRTCARANAPRPAKRTPVMVDEPARCKALLEKAYQGFASEDVRRQLLATAAVDCHYFAEWADFAPLDRWIEVLTTLLDAGPDGLSCRPIVRIRGALHLRSSASPTILASTRWRVPWKRCWMRLTRTRRSGERPHQRRRRSCSTT